MWFIFLAPLTAWTALGSIYAVAHGSTLTITALAADQWQRRKGYRKSEGHFTEREGNKYYGVMLKDLKKAKDITHDLSKRLSQLASFFPDEFAPFLGNNYDMTKSEGETLRAAMVPALNALKQYLDDLDLYNSTLANPQATESVDQVAVLVGQSFEVLKTTTYPVELFFKQFPKERVKSE